MNLARCPKELRRHFKSVCRTVHLKEIKKKVHCCVPPNVTLILLSISVRKGIYQATDRDPITVYVTSIGVQRNPQVIENTSD